MSFPKRANNHFMKPISILIFLIIIFFIPFILKPTILTIRDNDLGRTYIPLFDFIKKSIIVYNQIPLWHPDQMMGEAFVGNPISSLFYPANILFLLIDINFAVILYLIGHFLIAGVSTFFVAKSYNLSDHASIAAALFYAFSTKFMLHLSAGHLTMIAAFAYFPLAFLALRRLLVAPQIFWITIQALSLSLMYVTYPTIVYYALIFLGIYWLYHQLFHPPKDKIFALVFLKRKVFPFVGTLVVMAGLLSIILFPQIEFAPLSTRSQLTLEDVALPLWNFKRFITSLILPYLDFDSFDQESFLYLGTVPSLLFIAGFTRLANIKKIIFIFFGVLILMFVAGLSTPLFELTYNFVPLLKYSRITTRLWFIVALVVALLGAQALARVKNKKLVYLILAVFLLESFFIGYKKITSVPLLRFGNESLYQYLASDSDFFRVYCTTYCFNPQLISRYKIQVLHGESPIQDAKFVKFLESAGNYQYDQFAVIFPPYQVWQKENPPIPDPNLLGQANVKYVGSTYQLRNGNFDFINKFGDVYLYKNNIYKGRAFFENSEGNVIIAAYTPNEIELKFKKSAYFRNLILSENYYPGWYAYVDGQKLNVENYANVLRKVIIPPNSDSVLFKYQPSSFMLGRAITFGTIIFIILYFSRRSSKKNG